jgi:dTMP kinase
MAWSGWFVAFEGPEGSGKSTQMELLAKALNVRGEEVLMTREPGGTALGERIRTVLLDRDSTGMCAETEVLLLNAARAQHVREVICPALEQGKIVLCDRFVDSTLAYQGGGRGLTLDDLLTIQHFAVDGILPDMRILLDIDVETGLRRRRADSGTTNRLDDESLRFHHAVRDTFQALAQSNPAEWVVVDADKPRKIVAAEILRLVEQRLVSRVANRAEQLPVAR